MHVEMMIFLFDLLRIVFDWRKESMWNVRLNHIYPERHFSAAGMKEKIRSQNIL